jgi:hypothetical protein
VGDSRPTVTAMDGTDREWNGSVSPWTSAPRHRLANGLRCGVGAVSILGAGLAAGCNWQLGPDCTHTTLASLRVQPDSVTLIVGQQVALEAVGEWRGTRSDGTTCGRDGGPGDLTWQTNDSTVGRITLTYQYKANVEGVRVGQAAITATNFMNLEARAIVRVSGPAP